MKPLLFYDLDSKMPVAVGEQVARNCAILCKRATEFSRQIFWQKKVDLETLPTEPQLLKLV